MTTSESGKTEKENQQANLSACLDTLVYQDGECKPLTHRMLKYLEEAKARLDEASALFIEGLHNITHGFRLFSEAEEKGCEHPVLYYFMGECYRKGEKGATQDFSKASDYYDMAIKGTCAIITLYWFYTHANQPHLLVSLRCDPLCAPLQQALMPLLMYILLFIRWLYLGSST